MRESKKMNPVHTKKCSVNSMKLSSKAQQLLEELSKDLGLSKEVVASIAKELYRLYHPKKEKL